MEILVNPLRCFHVNRAKIEIGTIIPCWKPPKNSIFRGVFLIAFSEFQKKLILAFEKNCSFHLLHFFRILYQAVFRSLFC